MDAQFFALVVIWVGGWGFLFFNYPRFVWRMFGRRNPTPAQLQTTRRIGAVELVIIFISAVGVVIAGFFPK